LMHSARICLLCGVDVYVAIPPNYFVHHQ
jgi:hypothetical protein